MLTSSWLNPASPERSLTLATLIAFAVALACLAWAGIDPRWVHNPNYAAPVWLKPLKFSVSLAVYAGTVAWAMAYIRGRGVAVAGARTLSQVLAVVVLLELIYIVVQGLRGVPSHFNRNSSLERGLGAAMAAGAHIIIGVAAWLSAASLWALLRSPRSAKRSWGERIVMTWREEPLIWAIAVGFALTFCWGGYTGALLGQHRGPFVPGLAETAVLPFLGWRIDGQDLRISHFLGIHAMQIVPMCALLTRLVRLPDGMGTAAGALALCAAIWAFLP